MSKGSCRLEVGITLNMGNFSSIKSSLTFEEEYSGEGDDTREAKFQELLEVTNKKIAETIDALKPNFTIIKDGPKTVLTNKEGRVTLNEDDF